MSLETPDARIKRRIICNFNYTEKKNNKNKKKVNKKHTHCTL